MTPVLTSLIKTTSFDRNALAEKFSAACISYKNWSKTEHDRSFSGLATRIYRSGRVLALVQQRNHSQYWVLLPRGHILGLKDDSLAVRNESLDSLEQWLLTALLIRAMPRLLGPQDDQQQRLEADGLYYVINHRKFDKTSSILTTINIASVWSQSARKPRLAIQTATFTPVKAHEKPDGELPWKVAKVPRYELDLLGQNLARAGTGQYVKKAIWKSRKNRVPAIRLSGLVTLESYYKTRLGVLSLFKDDLQRAYGDLVKIELESIQPTDRKHVPPGLIEKSYTDLHDLMKQQPIWITNHSDDEKAGATLQAALLTLEIQSELIETIRADGLNILLVNDKEQYKNGKRDPYKEARKQYPDAIIQSCYPERLSKGENRHVVEVLVKELFIKSEIQQRKLMLDYPLMPSAAWFITSIRPADHENANKLSWPMFYCIVTGEHLELGSLPEHMRNALYENLTERQRNSVFNGYERSDLIFWPETGDALTMADTGAVCLPDEPAIHEIIQQFDQSAYNGVPSSLVSGYHHQNPDSSISNALREILAVHPEKIPTKAFSHLKYRNRCAKHFFDYLTDNGYRLKASLQSKNSGPLSSTTGIWINQERALYAAGDPGSAKRDQDNFNHIYHAEANGLSIPDWFWKSLEVWHVKHRGTTVYPFIFKHLREFGQREILSKNLLGDS